MVKTSEKHPADPERRSRASTRFSGSSALWMVALVGLLLGPLGSTLATPRADLPQAAIVLTQDELAAASAQALSLEVTLRNAWRDDRTVDSRIAAKAITPDASFEIALEAFLTSTIDVPLDSDERALLERLAGRPALVYQRHPETLADWFVPVVDAGAVARGLLRVDEVARASGAAAQAFNDGRAFKQSRPEIDGSLFVAALTDEGLGRLLKMAISEPQAVPKAAWLPLLDRSLDAGLIPSALRQADPSAILAKLAADTAGVAPALLEPWLAKLREAPDFADAALLRSVELMGMLPPPAQQEIDDAVLAALGRKDRGAAAALAIARKDKQIAIDFVRAHWPAASSVAKVNLATSLRLMESPEAEALLQELAARADAPLTVSSEVLR